MKKLNKTTLLVSLITLNAFAINRSPAVIGNPEIIENEINGEELFSDSKLVQTLDVQYSSLLKSNDYLKSIKDETENQVKIESPQNTEDDLVMYEYKAHEDVIPQKSEELSPAVKAVIKREIIENETGKKPRVLESETSFNQASPQDEINVTEASVIKKKISKTLENSISKEKKSEEKKANNFAAQDRRIVITTVGLNKENVDGFEFVPDYDRFDRVSDGNKGELELALSGESVGSLSGTIFKSEYVPTRIAIDSNESVKLSVPLFSEKELKEKFYQEENSESLATIIVPMRSVVGDVDIDQNFTKKIYVNENLEVVAEGDADYIVFTGVNPGIVYLKYKETDGEVFGKYSFIGENELLLDNGIIQDSEEQLVELSEKTPTNVKELEIGSENISMLGLDDKVDVVGMGAIKIAAGPSVDNSRKYLLIEKNSEKVILGVGSKSQKGEVPSTKFIQNVLFQNKLESIGDRCIVQYNFSQRPEEIIANGISSSTDMFTEKFYLDSEGNFTSEPDELTEKMFVIGEGSGIVGAKIKYSSGNEEAVTSICSVGNYVVEQL